MRISHIYVYTHIYIFTCTYFSRSYKSKKISTAHQFFHYTFWCYITWLYCLYRLRGLAEKGFHEDLAILQLDEPIKEFSDSIKPICLTEKLDKHLLNKDVEHSCAVAGFGGLYLFHYWCLIPFKSEFRSKKLIELIKTVFERNLNICIRLCVRQTDNTYVVDLIKALTCACFWGHISMVPQLAKLNSLYCKIWSYVRGFHCVSLFDWFKIKFIIIIIIIC